MAERLQPTASINLVGCQNYTKGGIMKAFFTGLAKWLGIGAVFGIGSSAASGTVSSGGSILSIIITLAVIVGLGALAIFLLVKFMK